MSQKAWGEIRDGDGLSRIESASETTRNSFTKVHEVCAKNRDGGGSSRIDFFRTYAKVGHPGAKPLLNKIYQDTEWWW